MSAMPILKKQGFLGAYEPNLQEGGLINAHGPSLQVWR